MRKLYIILLLATVLSLFQRCKERTERAERKIHKLNKKYPK